MYNRSDVWKNITMIIFYVLIALFILILLLRQTVYFEFCINGLKSRFCVRWGLFKIKRFGDFTLKTKSSTKFQSEQICQKKTTYKNMLASTNNENKAKLKNEILYEKLEKLKISRCILNCLTFENLGIYEEIGLLAPDMTALFLPILSNISMMPLNLLKIKFWNYKIVPRYSELKFKAKVTAKISFRIIDLIYCIIKEFLHKLLYSNKFMRRKRYE